MLATAESGWWQTTWPIISAPLFLVLGILGTILTGALMEREKAKSAKASRTFEWQRNNLMELHDQGLRVMRLLKNGDQEADFWDACNRFDQLRTRVLDDEVRELALAFIAFVVLAWGKPDDRNPAHNGWPPLNVKIGELLRTEYT